MNKYICLIVIISNFYAVRGTINPGFPCETIPNFCDRVHCILPENCDDGELIGGGGNCGCCQICVTYQGKGASCSDNYANRKPIDQPYGLSYHYNDICHPGLVCDTMGSRTCVVNLGGQVPAVGDDCNYQQTIYSGNTWEVKPNCDFYGDYAPIRYKGRDTPRTLCNDQDGNTIFGRITLSDVNVTCECSRFVDSLEKQLEAENKTTATLIRCDALGDFSQLQCWKDLCFCVDTQTRVITSGVIPIAGVKALPCFNSTVYNATFYTACQNESMRQQGIVDELGLKGVSGILVQLPRCDYDGTYSAIQDDGNRQFCSAKDGVQIGSFVNEGVPNLDMNCHCARDNSDPEGLPNSYRFDDCGSIGNYNPRYSVTDQYYCLDSDGQQSSETYTVEQDILCPGETDDTK